MKFGAAILMVALLALSAFAGVRVVVPQLPPSPYDDTEISTNVMFSAGEEDALIFSLSISIDATPTNTLQIAFGRDENSDSILDWQETEFLLGWKCGVWFFRDKTTETEMIAAKESGLRHLEWRLSLNSNRAPCALAATDGGNDIGFAVSPGMFNPSWDFMRVTARGMPGPVYSAGGAVSAPGFSVRVR
ncbi:MAG: hypothetical protein K6G94_02800 [Kiritimatiellae bacterium]|nr:hypothetical protein [Kiritimatiellia bacterium]